MAESDFKSDNFFSEISCSRIVQFECLLKKEKKNNSLNEEVSSLEMCVISLTFHL